MRKTTALLVLTIFVLGVYYPVIFAGVNSLDDFRMLDELPRAGSLDMLSLFNPLHARSYFRPLTILSYYFDNSILDLSPQAMHLENILIHLVNTLLVLWVGLAVFRERERRVELAFVAGCLFALHPLNVEAVAWISGRTDPLATLFALLALACLYRFVESERLCWLWYTALICLIGALAKETALFCLPAAFLLACANEPRLRSSFTGRRWNTLFIRGFWMVLPFILFGTAYLSVRLTALRYVTKNIVATKGAGGGGNIVSSFFRLLQEVFTIYGFYIKKLFLPLPLNFAITEINGTYLWLGLCVLLLIIYCLLRRMDSIAVQMMLATLLVMASAFVISRARIAWTPYAERYLYLPTVFFAFGIVDAGSRFCSRYLHLRTGVIAAFIVLGLMTGATAQRAMIWQNNLSLYQDTIRKSPDFGCISNELAIALTADNRTDEAMAQIERGKKASNQGDMVLLYVNQASILGEKKQYKEAYKALACTYKNKDIGSAHIEVIKSYINLMERERINTTDRKRSKKLLSKLADLHELYYKRSGDTDHLYRAAQLALAAGNRDKAHAFFLEAAERAPKESMYKEFARKMAKKTE
jgi:tetratricopeptide (TPR) repeat protein